MDVYSEMKATSGTIGWGRFTRHSLVKGFLQVKRLERFGAGDFDTYFTSGKTGKKLYKGKAGCQGVCLVICL